MVHRPDDIAADLPPPRDDEPASLRQDILDELGDHLRCALDRERQRQAAVSSGAAATPEQRALERFGNPAQLALRLWWDAMREKIMTRRLVVGVALLMFVLGGAVAGVLFQQLLRQQAMMADFQQRMAADAAEQARRHAEQLDLLRRESQEATSRLVNSAQAETAAAQAALEGAQAAREQIARRLAMLEGKLDQPGDWNPMEITLRRLKPDGPPAVGFRVRLGVKEDENVVSIQEAVSGEDGRVRFDRVRYGLYELKCTAPWQEVSQWTVRIEPGESYRNTLACPESAPQPIKGRLRLQLPDDLRDREFWLFVNPQLAERQFAGTSWSNRTPIIRSHTNRVVSGANMFGTAFPGTPMFIANQDGAVHFQTASKFAQMAPMLDLGPDRQIQGIQLPGEDYRLLGVRVYVRASLDAETPDSQPPRLLPIQGATFNPDEVILRAAADEGTIWIVPSEPRVTALRKAFAQIDADRAAGRAVVTTDAMPFRGAEAEQILHGPTLLPQKWERLAEDDPDADTQKGRASR